MAVPVPCDTQLLFSCTRFACETDHKSARSRRRRRVGALFSALPPARPSDCLSLSLSRFTRDPPTQPRRRKKNFGRTLLPSDGAPPAVVWAYPFD